MFMSRYILLTAIGVGSWVNHTTVLAAEAIDPTKTTPPSSVSTDPSTTTATFGDWQLRCQRLPDGSKPARICEVAETIQIQGQPGPIAEIAIGRVAADKPLVVTVVVPANVSFPSAVHISTKDRDQSLDWVRCTPGGCFSAASAIDDALKVWRAASEPGKLSFKDSSGREIGFPLSFKGLSQAVDALAKAQ